MAKDLAKKDNIEDSMVTMMMMVMMMSIMGSLITSASSSLSGTNINWEWVLANTQLGQYEQTIPGSGSVIGDWHSGTASGGKTGDDVISIGESNKVMKVHSFVVDISGFTLAANVSIRIYQDVNGIDTETYNQVFIAGTDPDGLWIVNGTLSINGQLRMEVYSDNAADDGVSVGYEYTISSTPQ